MKNFKFPALEDMKKIRVKLDSPRLIVYPHKKNTTQKTLISLELNKYEGKMGIYLICKNGKVGYVGATTDFKDRMLKHTFLQRNPKIKYVFFYEEKNKTRRLLYEMICKYHYFGKVKVEWNYAVGERW